MVPPLAGEGCLRMPAAEPRLQRKLAGLELVDRDATLCTNGRAAVPDDVISLLQMILINPRSQRPRFGAGWKSVAGNLHVTFPAKAERAPDRAGTRPRGADNFSVAPVPALISGHLLVVLVE